MPDIELNIGQLPTPRRQREDDEETPFRIVVLGDFSGRPRPTRRARAPDPRFRR